MKYFFITAIVFLLISASIGLAYYGNPYVEESNLKKSISPNLGTRGGFKEVLIKRYGLGKQIDQQYMRKTVQGDSAYSFSEARVVRDSVKNKAFFVIKNEHSQYRTPITYAEEKVKDKLAKTLGISAIFDPAAHKNVLIYKIPTRKFIELLRDPRSRTETFRGRDIDVSAVLESVGLGEGAFVPRIADDNIKY